MRRLEKIREFINREKIYFWLLIFIILVNILVFLGAPKEVSLKELEARQAEKGFSKDEYSLTPEKLNILIKEKKEVVIVMNLLVMLVIFLLILGLVLDFFIIFFRPKDTVFLEAKNKPISDINWVVWDVCKAVILFMFFGYILTIIEAALAGPFPLIKEKEHIRMMFNSSILDAAIVIFVLYTLLVEYKNKLKKLGLSLADFFKNVFLGIAGYVAALPLIIAALFTIVWIATLINYEPPLEPILRLFLEEKNIIFLMYSTIFVTIFGPIFEEIFFRGFMYPALRKKIGVIGAIGVSSVLFSALHTNTIGLLPIILLGILLAYLYERTGSLIPSIIVHIIHNTGMLTFVFLMKEFKV